MDGYTGQQDSDAESNVAMEAPPLVRFDERRMHVRAYNYWASLLHDRSFPSIEDLNPEEIEDFGSHSVLLDFTGGVDDPAIAFLGSALSRECGLDSAPRRISDVPPRTLLSRLTDHYLQIIANEAPIGFEAEFTNQRGAEILYRGILMPFSSDDRTINFVYGVINWKEVASPVVTDDIERAVSELLYAASPTPTVPVWADGPLQAVAHLDDEADELEASCEDELLLDDMGRCLADAREAAADAISFEGRSRKALYRALGLAHGFALLARARPDDYRTLLEDSGIATQPRSPMTALVKLIFGSHYDKTRLSEFAVVIDHGLREEIAPGTLGDHIAAHPGGLKGYVRDARAARRGPVGPRDPLAEARVRLASARSVPIDSIDTDEGGVAVVVMRKQSDGSFQPLGGMAGNDRRVRQILKAVAAQQG